MRFARHIGIDYSGAQKPESRLKTLQVYEARADHAPTKVSTPTEGAKNWTRLEVAQFCATAIETGERVIIGIDHAFSFPMSYMERFGIETWDHTLIGARAEDGLSGSAYIFERQPDGQWSEVAKLTATYAAFGDRFGGSVSLSGDQALIGAHADGDDDAGSAYVFENLQATDRARLFARWLRVMVGPVARALGGMSSRPSRNSSSNLRFVVAIAL